jgi:hypothetical protein
MGNRIRDPESVWPWIQYPGWKNSDPGSGIYIPDPQHWILATVLRIRDVYPGSWFLPIPDPGSRIPDPKTIFLRAFWQFFW